jgi:hypothetical protein
MLIVNPTTKLNKDPNQRKPIEFTKKSKEIKGRFAEILAEQMKKF